MKKDDFIKMLRKLNYKHNNWYAAAEAIIMFVETESDNIPKSYTDCEIGKWLYGKGYQLSKFESFIEIEGIHIKLHQQYLDIYKAKAIYENQKNKNLKKYLIMQKENLRKLKGISNILIDKIEDFVKEINKMDNNIFLKKLV